MRLIKVNDWQTYRLLAAHLYDIYAALNSRIVDNRGYRPTWKVSEITDEATGKIVESIADDLQPLRALYEKIEALGKDSFQLELTERSAPAKEE